MPEADSPWKIKSSRITYQNNWMRIREDSVVTPTGKDGIYAVLESNDSVKVIALNDKHEIFLIYKFRYTDQTWSWELPGGGGDKQDPLTAAKRELEEESGITADSWQKLGRASLCDGFMTEREYTFLATGIALAGKPETSDEIISDSGFFSLDDVNAMIDDGRIDSGETLASLMLFHRWQAKLKDSQS